MAFGANDPVIFGHDDEVVGSGDETVPTGGGPQTGRVYRTRKMQADQSQRDWNNAPWYAKLTMAPDELQPGGQEARNAATAEAGRVLLSQPGALAGQVAQMGARVAENVNPAIDAEQAGGRVAAALTPDQLPGTAEGGIMPPAVSDFLAQYPLAATGAEVLGDAAILAPAGRALPGAAAGVRDAMRSTPKPYLDAPIADVARRYTVVPEDVQQSAGLPTQGGIKGSTRSNLGPQVAGSEVPIQNIKALTKNVTADLPGELLDSNGRVDSGLLKQSIAEQGAPYDQVKQLPTPADNTLAGRVQAAWDARGGSLKGDAVAESRLAPLMNPEAAPMSTSDLLKRWRELNSYASDLRKASGEGSASAQIKAGDLRSVSDAILDEIDARAAAHANPQLTAALQEARTNIARLHSLNDSLDSTGWVDPTKLRQMAEQHVPLSGGLAQGAADAAAAPRSLRPIGSAIDAQSSQLDRYGREPHSWLRNVVGHLGGNKLARGGIEALNSELRMKGTGMLERPVVEPPMQPLYGPNEGPPLDPGRQSLALRSGDLELAPDMPPGYYSGAPRVEPRSFSDTIPLSLEGAGPPLGPTEAFDQGALPWRAPRRVQPLQGPVQSLSDMLGPVGEMPGLNEGIEGPGIPNQPRGVSGPRSAQLTSPRPVAGFDLSEPSVLDYLPAEDWNQILRELGGEAAPSVEMPNNASGQTAASLEAISALKQQRPRFRVNADTGVKTPLPGLEARDPKAGPGELIVEEDGQGGYTVIDRGATPGGHVRGILERMKSHKE